MNYPDRLLRDIGKLYRLPQTRTKEYAQIRKQINYLFTALYKQTTSHSETSQTRAQIIDKLSAILSKLALIPTKEYRSDERVTTIAEFAAADNFVPKRILDLGAGDAKITIALKEYYNLPTEDVYALDFKLPEIQPNTVTPITYENGNIPLADASIDLIILFVVLHHIPPDVRPHILQEIGRILSPNGMVVIREHDDDKDPKFYVYLDLVHILWYIAKQETADPLYPLSKAETEQLFSQNNMVPSQFHMYPSPNPKRIYHEVFKHANSTPYEYASMIDSIVEDNFRDGRDLIIDDPGYHNTDFYLYLIRRLTIAPYAGTKFSIHALTKTFEAQFSDLVVLKSLTEILDLHTIDPYSMHDVVSKAMRNVLTEENADEILRILLPYEYRADQRPTEFHTRGIEERETKSGRTLSAESSLADILLNPPNTTPERMSTLIRMIADYPARIRIVAEMVGGGNALTTLAINTGAVSESKDDILTWAAAIGSIQIADQLIKAGADIYYNEHAALMAADYYEQTDMVNWLQDQFYAKSS